MCIRLVHQCSEVLPVSADAAAAVPAIQLLNWRVCVAMNLSTSCASVEAADFMVSFCIRAL